MPFCRKFMMRASLSLSLLLPASLMAQEKSHKTLWPDGVNAAAYTDISVDRGKIFGADVSNLRLVAGLQLVRLWDILSISVGYGKVGFFDAVHDWNKSFDKFQFNYQAPVLGLELAPNWPVSIEAQMFYNASGKSVEKVPDTLLTGLDSGDYRRRYEYEVSDLTLLGSVRIWRSFKLIFGLGNRTLSWEKGIYMNNTEVSTVTDSDRPSVGEETEQYILLGIRGTQMMDW